jgi:hypothetical protein
VNVAQSGLFGSQILDRLDLVDGYPRLDSGLESSVPGLHFLGATAAYSFGPLMRFVPAHHLLRRRSPGRFGARPDPDDNTESLTAMLRTYLRFPGTRPFQQIRLLKSS